VGGNSQNQAPSCFPRSFRDLTPKSFLAQRNVALAMSSWFAASTISSKSSKAHAIPARMGAAIRSARFPSGFGLPVRRKTFAGQCCREDTFDTLSR
jgi:hypothetical protein